MNPDYNPLARSRDLLESTHQGSLSVKLQFPAQWHNVDKDDKTTKFGWIYLLRSRAFDQGNLNFRDE